ncbi:MAG: DUF3048 domain-containing protein [Ruminococcaceae bacterium]|nr:DUF3048 domain-containing protein [Oscillospiraceae bacterium]
MKKIISLLLCLCLAFTFVACTGQTVILDDDEEQGGELGVVEVTAAKESFNMLTGENNLANDRVGWRPIAISVNNISPSWPQSGISGADVIVEIETEHGITRLMCLFGDTREIGKIGSLRSLRDPFMEFLYPLDAIIVHIGTSVLAQKAMLENNYRTIDADIEENYFVKTQDKTRLSNGYASEHTWFTSGSQVEKGIETLGLTTESQSAITAMFNFVTDGSTVTPTGGTAASVAYDFNDSTDNFFKYNDGDGLYYKSQYASASYPEGKPHMDEAANQQLCFKNVFVLYCDMSFTGEPRGADSLAQVDYSAGGTGYYFSNGAYEQVTWTKGDFASQLKVFDVSGNELSVNTGKSYISMVDKEFAETMTIA